MKIKKLRELMNPNLKVSIYDPGNHSPWIGNSGDIPSKYLDQKVFSLNPSHISYQGQWEYDCIDVWIEALPDTICRGSDE